MSVEELQAKVTALETQLAEKETARAQLQDQLNAKTTECTTLETEKAQL